MNPYVVPGIVIIGKHQLRFFVPELSADELIVSIPYLNSHLFQIKKRIIALIAQNIACDTETIFTRQPVIIFLNDLYHFVGRHFTARVFTGRMPVVDSGTP